MCNVYIDRLHYYFSKERYNLDLDFAKSNNLPSFFNCNILNTLKKKEMECKKYTYY